MCSWTFAEFVKRWFTFNCCRVFYIYHRKQRQRHSGGGIPVQNNNSFADSDLLRKVHFNWNRPQGGKKLKYLFLLLFAWLLTFFFFCIQRAIRLSLIGSSFSVSLSLCPSVQIKRGFWMSLCNAAFRLLCSLKRVPQSEQSGGHPLENRQRRSSMEWNASLARRGGHLKSPLPHNKVFIVFALCVRWPIDSYVFLTGPICFPVAFDWIRETTPHPLLNENPFSSSLRHRDGFKYCLSVNRN